MMCGFVSFDFEGMMRVDMLWLEQFLAFWAINFKTSAVIQSQKRSSKSYPSWLILILIGCRSRFCKRLESRFWSVLRARRTQWANEALVTRMAQTASFLPIGQSSRLSARAIYWRHSFFFDTPNTIGLIILFTTVQNPTSKIATNKNHSDN